MSQDYTQSKGPLAGVSPLNIKDSAYQRLEPILTPELLKTRFLFGVPLVSAIKNPITGQRDKMTDEMVRDTIQGAISDAESEASMVILPTQFNEKYEFDRAEYLSFGYFQLKQKPVYSLDGMFVTPANNVDVFTVPLDWVETSNMVTGQVNIIPIGIALNGSAFGGGVVSGVGAGAAAFLAILGNQNWIPAFWRVVYTAGYPDGLVPRQVNDLIGVIAAIRILSEIGATHAQIQGSSLGVDGISQSVSTPGPNIYEPRIAKLEEQKKQYLKVVKKQIGNRIVLGNI